VDPDFPELTVPHLISPYECNDIVRDLNLLKIQAGLLASLLGRICYSKMLVIQEMPAIIVIIFFSKDGKLVYFIDVGGVMQELGCTHNPEEWRLFVHVCI
jgi:hypothetical protein